MAESSLVKVLDHLRKVAAMHAYRDLADGELLERFVKAHDDAAFSVLIERHGAMVQGLCRRMLGNLHDAEDVCQATFLVLARRASAIRKSTVLSSWLHGVACRMAAHLKRDRARRRCRERRSQRSITANPANEVSWREAQTILDEELDRLPHRYRAPLILCYLEGKTRDEATRRLRLSPGTLHARLQRGRDLLRDRLTRRGLTFSRALFVAVLSDSAARAAIAPTLVIATAKAALAVAVNQPLAQGVISTSVLALTREALKTMFMAKLKLGTVVAFASLAVAMTCVSWTSRGDAQELALTNQAAPKPAGEPSASQAEGDEAFIRRVSRELRGTEPTPTEVHFFLATKDAGKRQKLIDLMIQERQAKKRGDQAEASKWWTILDGSDDGVLKDHEFPKRAEPPKEKGWMIELGGHENRKQPAEPPKRKVRIIEFQWPETKPQIDPVEVQYSDDLAALFKQFQVQMRAEPVDAFYVDDLPAYFKQLKKR
jgi:RNA polymerase sigma factor (sigma-70 family)